MNEIRVALVGARGYVGFELLQLLDAHPLAQVVAAFSREFKGKAISDIVKGFSDRKLCYQAGEFKILLEMDLDVIFLALPNDLAKKHDTLWQGLAQNTVIIDLSSDYRFDDNWVYGQPETCKDKVVGQKMIANPGCYATASQLGLLPIIEYCDSSPSIFGVSGYSGAGSSPVENNDPKRLADNLKAYKLTDHIHEREVSRVLGRSVYFMPHVAEFFRGIHLTISIELNKAFNLPEIIKLYQQYYRSHELIHVTSDIPEVQKIQNTHHVIIGGFNLKDRHLVLCVCIDNLLKGAATQAIQNMNLALSCIHELTINTGITNEK